MNSFITTAACVCRRRERGFTLIEIMIVVVIIGFLAALAIPSVLGAWRRSQNSAFANDLRQVRAAAEEYAMENGGFPPDGAAALGPAFDGYLSSAIGNGPTPVGGVWDWDYEQFGYKAGVSVYRPTAGVGQMQEIDRLIDDGDLGTGNFRARSQGYIYVIEF